MAPGVDGDRQANRHINIQTDQKLSTQRTPSPCEGSYHECRLQEWGPCCKYKHRNLAYGFASGSKEDKPLFKSVICKRYKTFYKHLETLDFSFFSIFVSLVSQRQENKIFVVL